MRDSVDYLPDMAYVLNELTMIAVNHSGGGGQKC